METSIHCRKIIKVNCVKNNKIVFLVFMGWLELVVMDSSFQAREARRGRCQSEEDED
jgi:hypothetical protein